MTFFSFLGISLKSTFHIMGPLTSNLWAKAVVLARMHKFSKVMTRVNPKDSLRSSREMKQSGSDNISLVQRTPVTVPCRALQSHAFQDISVPLEVISFCLPVTVLYLCFQVLSQRSRMLPANTQIELLTCQVQISLKSWRGLSSSNEINWIKNFTVPA